MENIEKTLNEELRNNDCIENLVNAIDSQKSIYDAFVVDGKLVIVFNDELETNEVEKMQAMLKSMDGCGEVFSEEFELGYKENFKSLTLDLLTDNVSIGKFEQGGKVDWRELEDTLKRIKQENPSKKVGYSFIADAPKGYRISINGKYRDEQGNYHAQGGEMAKGSTHSIDLDTNNIEDEDFQKYLKYFGVSYKVISKAKGTSYSQEDVVRYIGTRKSLLHLIDDYFAVTREDGIEMMREIKKMATGGEMEDYYDGQGDEGYGNTFEELRSQIVLGVMEDLRIPRETAEKVVLEKEEMLTDLIENHGETNIYSLVQKAQEEDDSYARHMETRRRMRNDEDTYPKGFNEFAKGGEVNKKNSIEWLFNHMGNEAAGYTTEMHSGEALDYAKQMHKQEIIDAWKNGDTELPNEQAANKFAEKYYNQTFLGVESDYYQHAKGGEVAKYKNFEMVVISKELNKDGGRNFKDRILVSATNVKEAKEIATKLWKERINDESDLMMLDVLTDSELRQSKKYAKGGNVRSKGDEITLTKSEINKYIKLSQKIDELIERQDKLSHDYNDENDILERSIRNLSENLQDFEEQLYEKYNDRSKVIDLLSSHIYETYAKGGMLDKYEFIDSLTDIYKIRSKWFAIGKRYGIETKGEGYTKKEALENLDLHLSYVTEKDKYAKGGEVGNITPALNRKVSQRAEEIYLKEKGKTSSDFDNAFDKAIIEFGYKPSIYHAVMQEIGPEYGSSEYAKGGEVKMQMDYRLSNKDEHNVEAMWLELSKDKSKTRGEIIDAISDELKINWFEISSWIKRNYKTYAQGGEMAKDGKAQSNFRGIDLFEDYEMQEPELKKIVQKINDAYDKDAISTLFLNRILRQTEKIGYTFEFDMDGGAYGLRPIGVDIIEVQGYEEYAKGGQIAKDFYVVVQLPNGLITKKDFDGFSKDKIIQWCEEKGWKYNSKGEKLGGQILKNYEFFVKEWKRVNVGQLPSKKYAIGGEVKKISTTTQVKRNLRGSGAFTLELEMAVYVPSTTVADQIISKTLFQKRIQEVEKYLSKLFGGYSSNAVEGGYVSQEKGLIKEDVAKVTAFGTEDAIKKNFKPLMRQISKWCESWGQESMGFEFEGDLYYVSKDAKFSKGGKIENKTVKPKFVKNAKK